MKSLDMPIVFTPTLTLPPQEGEGNSRVSGWTLNRPPGLEALLYGFQERPRLKTVADLDYRKSG